jgi:hypothetical protein
MHGARGGAPDGGRISKRRLYMSIDGLTASAPCSNCMIIVPSIFSSCKVSRLCEPLQFSRWCTCAIPGDRNLRPDYAADGQFPIYDVQSFKNTPPVRRTAQYFRQRIHRSSCPQIWTNDQMIRLSDHSRQPQSNVHQHTNSGATSRRASVS